MKWLADIKLPGKTVRCEIEYDELAGYYLYVWENDKGITDELQDTFESAARRARDLFQVPLDAWRKVE
ncbi:MAG: hypothetical protein GC131_09055 [Alphaproteobacteria bacterium]|nr:hypothetical protein [Alphaproteobacteria bacterium]